MTPTLAWSLVLAKQKKASAPPEGSSTASGMETVGSAVISFFLFWLANPPHDGN